MRLCVLLGAAGETEFGPSHGDMKFYHDWAQRIAGGQWTDGHAFYGLPLYAYWLATIYTLFGNQPYLAVLGQTLAEGGTVLLLYRIGIRLFPRDLRAGKIVGSAAAIGWIFFQPAQTYATVLMPTSLFVLAFWAVVWWIVREAQERRGELRLRDFALLGVAVGAVAMMVANVLFLLPLVLAVLAAKQRGTQLPTPERTPRHSPTWRNKLAAAALLFLGITAGASPCWLHNWAVCGEPVFLSAHSGLNFYMGNNPMATGYPKVPAGLRADQQGLLLDSITSAERAVGHPLRRAEVSAYWSARAKQFIVHQPAAWLQLLGIKIRNFWSGFVYDDISVITPLRDSDILFPGPSFALVATLALAGAFLVIRRQPAVRWIAAAVALQIASLLTVFITERYRLATVPGLLLLGCAGLWEMAAALRERRLLPVASYAVMLAASAVFVYWPQRDASLLTIDDYNASLADLRADRVDAALTRLERVLALQPANAEANFAIGNAWLAKGDHDRAKFYYRRTLELEPTHKSVLNNLGVLALQEGRWAWATQFLTAALRSEPDDPNYLYLLAEALWHDGRPVEARASIDRALAVRPGERRLEQLRADIAAGGTPAAFRLN